MVTKQEEKDLKIITLDHNMSTHFYDLIMDVLDYNANILVKEDYIAENYSQDELENKKDINKKNIRLKFRLENESEDDYDIAIYSQIIGEDNVWEYLDNVRYETYKKGVLDYE